MPLTDAQKDKLKTLTDDERAEFLEALGGKGDPDLAKTVEILQGEVAGLKKSLTRKGNEERRKGAKRSWFEEVFGGS